MKVRVGFSPGVGAAMHMGASTFWSIIDDLEAEGWDSVWLSERVNGDLPDCLAALAAVAGRTRRLKFGMSVLVVPGRNPVLLAKQLATIAVLSDDRFVPAFGLGSDAPGESVAFGVDRSERAARTDEAVVLMRALWSGGPIDHSGRFFTVNGIDVGPRPSKPLDVWFGGHSEAAARRVGRLGDGWMPSFITPAEFAARLPVIDRVASEHERAVDPEHFGVLVPYIVPEAAEATTSTVLAAIARRRPEVDPRDVVVIDGYAALRAQLERFIAVGASKFVVVPAVAPTDWRTELNALRAQVAVVET